MASWKTVLTVNGQVLDYVHIRRWIFQKDSLSPLLYVIAMIPMTTILRQTGLGYQTSKSAAKISHLLYMDDLKLYRKSSNELESLLNTVRIFSTDISMEFGLEKCATLTIHKGKATHTDIVKQQHHQRAESRRELQVPRCTAGRGRQTSSSEEANICRIYQQST